MFYGGLFKCISYRYFQVKFDTGDEITLGLLMSFFQDPQQCCCYICSLPCWDTQVLVIYSGLTLWFIYVLSLAFPCFRTYRGTVLIVDGRSKRNVYYMKESQINLSRIAECLQHWTYISAQCPRAPASYLMWPLHVYKHGFWPLSASVFVKT